VANVTGKQPYSYGGPGLRLVSYEPTAQLSGVADSIPDTAPAPLVGTNISVNSGSLGLTGQIEYNYGGPGLRLIGFEPSIAIAPAGITVNPGTGSLSVTGEVPLTLVPLSVAPDEVDLVVTGVIPTLDQTANHARAPPTGSLPLAGVVPSLYGGTPIEPSAGSLTLTGYAPSVDIISQSVDTLTGSLTLEGYQSYNYGGPGLRLIGYEPSVTIAGQLVFPGSGALSLSGLIPFLPTNATVEPVVSAISVTGLVPDKSVTIDTTITIDFTSSLSITGLNPDIRRTTATASPDTANLALTGHEPEVTSVDEVIVKPGKGILSLTGYLEYNYGGPGLRLIGYEPTLSGTSELPVSPENDALQLVAHRPSIEITLIPAVFERLIVTGYEPEILIGGTIVKETDTASLALEGHAPTLDIVLAASPPPATLTLESHSPSIEITVKTGSFDLLLLTGYAPEVVVVQLGVPVGSLSLTGHIPTVGYDWVISPDTGAVNLTGYGFTFDTTLPVGETASLELDSYAPLAQISTTGRLTLAGQSPQLTILGLLPVPLGGINLSGHAPSLLGRLEEPEQPSGGYEFWDDFDRELQRRKRRRAKRIRDREKAKRIADKLTRELALAERALEEETARKDELARINKLVSDNRPAIEQMGSERLALVMREALESQTFSKMERLERELTQMREEEMFLLMATQILINQ